MTNLQKIIDSTKKHKGLGDTVAAVTKAVGISQCEPCKKRQEQLNKVLPYKKP
jgi:hypothetical protein